MENKINKLIQKLVNNKTIFGVVLRIERADGEVLFDGAAGELRKDSQYFIASTTKLYTVAIIMKLRAEGKLNLDDKISKFFGPEVVQRLNVYKGVDYSDQITIQHLLSHTSGIPDYFGGKNTKGTSLEKELTEGKDRAWGLEDVLRVTKTMQSTFKPGQKGKALYSDTNFQLLGRIIEQIRSNTIENVFRHEIFELFGMKDTYMYTAEPDQKPAAMYFMDKRLFIPRAMKSTRADGGIVSTSYDSMSFIKNFFSGRFFPKSYFEQMMTDYRNVMFPLQYGTGLMRFKLPGLMTGFRDIPELLGHSGLSGAFEYYCPAKGIYLTGTVNQISNPSISYRMLVMVLSLIK